MSSKKHRRRARRHAEASADAAWDAVAEGNFTFAEKLSLRAVTEGPMNARLWKEHAEILALAGKPDEAVRAAKNALLISPEYLEVRTLLEKLAPRAPRVEELVVDPLAEEAELEVLLEQTSEYDWKQIEAELTERGAAKLSSVLTLEQCGALRAMFDQDELFEHEVTLDEQHGGARYRFFRRPLPSILVETRARLYPRVAAIANIWQELLARKYRFPRLIEDYLAHCGERGHTRPSAILLKYLEGQRNTFHQDTPGVVHFPIQCALSLGPGGARDGGELVLTDVRAGRHRREVELATEIGDAVLFCTRERICRVGGLPALQPVMHGVKEVLAAERYAAGLPFHDYPGA
jgi:uncharacterized protein